MPCGHESRFERALASGVPVSEGVFSVGGRRVAVRCAGVAHWDDLTSSLLPADVGPADFRLDLWDADETGVRPERSAEEEAAFAEHGEAFVYTPDGRQIRHFAPDFDLRFDQETGVGSGWIVAARAPAWQRLRPWQRVLVSALAGSGVESVHAAMVSRNGAGVLLPGPNGSGKSSTTFACLAAGLRFLGDDAIAVELGDQGPSGNTVHAVAKLSVVGLSRVPELAAASEPYEDPVEDERALRLAAGSARVAASAPIAAIAFPRLADSERSRVRPLPGGRAATELFAASLSHAPWRIGDSFSAMADLAAAAPAYTLEVGRDPAGVAAAVESLIA